ncbi:hypothetical protein F8388_005009, partial [Cannabis sativa]
MPKSNQRRIVKTPAVQVGSLFTRPLRESKGPIEDWFWDIQHMITFSVSILESCLLFKCCLLIPHLRPTEYKRSRLSRNRKTVNRPYGGVLSGRAVRERIFKHIFLPNNYQSTFGGRTEDCKEGFEDPESKRKVDFKEISCECEA